VKTLILDNYDSFTFNLFQAIAGIDDQDPIVLRNDDVDLETLRQIPFDNLIISPGPGRPDVARDFGVCGQAIACLDVPILGICLGCEGIANAFGGRIEPTPVIMHGRLSAIEHDADALFEGVPQMFRAVRYHSLAVAEPLPECLKKIAWTRDGIVMGVRHASRPLWGLQFHPESICTDYGITLLRNFKRISEQTRPRPCESPLMLRDSKNVKSVLPVHTGTRPSVSDFEVTYRRVEGTWDAASVFIRLYGEANCAFWLDSSLVHQGLSRFSFMGDASGPESMLLRYDVDSKVIKLHRKGNTETLDEDVFGFLKRELAARYCQAPDLPFEFAGGFVGYLGYEMKADCGAVNHHHSHLPDASFILADRFIAIDHGSDHLYLVSHARPGASAESWFDEMEDRLACVQSHDTAGASEELIEGVSFSRSASQYADDVRRCLAKIAEGESYELCLTNRIHCPVSVDPLDYYLRLRRINPAPFAAFLRFDDYAVACSSPERFLKIDGSGTVETKPIKGTLRRGGPGEDDSHFADALRGCEKNRSENLMIVDLMRNDLGMVCEVGSVHVPKLMDVESYATVHQMVSTVCGTKRRDVDAVDCVRQAFPGGSMTGAPKRRSMEILDSLEKEARGIYSGALGYFGFGGTVDLGMTIRTAVIESDRVMIGCGGGVVALSDPDEEVEEMKLKARALLDALRQSPTKHKKTVD
jgi:para-aminobenzoate synthetase